MVILRLQRIGKKKEPHFRLIAQEKDKDPHDKSLEILGFVNPRTKERRIKKDKVEKWLSTGAQCTDTVYNLLIDEGIIKGEKRKTFKISKKRIARKEGKKAPAQEAEVPPTDNVGENVGKDKKESEEKPDENKKEPTQSPADNEAGKKIKEEKVDETKKENEPDGKKPEVKKDEKSA